MIDLRDIQQKVYHNKVVKGFNVTDVNLEFCYLYGELSEAFEAHRKNLPDMGEELADVAIYLLGLSQILGVDLEQEILKKVAKNEQREYRPINGINVRTKEA
jgi:hypothetical protein